MTISICFDRKGMRVKVMKPNMKTDRGASVPDPGDREENEGEK